MQMAVQQFHGDHQSTDQLDPGMVSSIDNLICNGDAPQQFNSDVDVSGSLGINFYFYEWQDSAASGSWSNAPGFNGNLTYQAGSLTETTYFRRKVVVQLCQEEAFSNEIMVEVLPAVELAGALITHANCKGGEDGEATVLATGGAGNFTYAWSDGQSGATAIGLAEGGYAYTATDAFGCSASDSVNIGYINELPTVDLGADIETTESTATIYAPAGFSAYVWSTGETTDSIIVDANGDFWLIATDGNGCSNADTINVSLWPLGINSIGEAQNVLVYPNPSRGMFTVETPGWAKEQLEWSIYDLGGTLIQSGNFGAQTSDVRGQIDLNGTATGIYMLNLKAGEHETYIRLVIQ